MSEGIKKPEAHKSGLFLGVAVAIFALFCIMLNQTPWSGTSVRDARGTVGHVENPWVLRQQDRVLYDSLELPEYLPLEQGKLYTLSTVMTYDGSVDEIPYGFLHLDHMYCRVLLGGEVLFSCMPEDLQRWDRAKSPGFIYKTFPVPRDCLGQELEIQLLPPLTTPVDYGLPEVEFGDFSSVLRAAMIRDMPHNVVTILCILLGVSAILFSTVTLHGSDYQEGLSIGAFSLLFSLYLITECSLNAFFVGNPYYLYLLNYIPFSLMPLSLMGFMRERLLQQHRKLCTAVIAGEITFFVLEMFLHFGGILDMRELIPVIQLIYFGDMALVTVLILFMKDRRRKRSLVLQITPVIIGMMIDGLVYWLHWEIGGNDATFTILGVLLFLLIELIHVWHSSVCIYTESVRSSLYRQLAYVDGLTEVGNRRAYDKEIEEVAAGRRFGRSMIVASADVNRLKYVNDHYGHAAGDKLIRSAARLMAEAVGDRGKVFRTGGDEFAVFLYYTEPDQFEAIWKTVEQGIEAFNGENAFTLSLAMGYVQLRDHRILEAVQEADRRMYENKLKLKMARDQSAEAEEATE